MAAEEDKKFDAVLGGFLVNELRARAGDLHCPESDTLAAYHERSLLPEEMNSWKEHIVGCARCQANLAELEATDSIPLQVSEKEGVPLTATALPAAVAGQAAKPATATLPEKSRVTPILRGVLWRWLVPAGAIAAGLLVWIAWHENRPPLVKPAAEATTAKMKQPATPPAPLARDERLSASMDEVARLSKDQGAAGGVAPAKPAREAQGLKRFDRSHSRRRVTRPEPHTDKEVGARADAAFDSLAATNRAQNQPAQDAKAGVAGAASQTVEVQTLTANGELQSQQIQQNLQVQQNQSKEQKTSGPDPSRHLEKKKAESPPLTYRASTALPTAPPPAAPAPVAAFNDGASVRLAAAVSPYLISVPGKKTLWRAGHAGMIEFSNDGGASWSRQTSNVLVDLTAGSATSEKVCWIVGQGGTILLTTDAGTHWSAVHSPLVEDLGGVRATDALHATIWNLANTKAFETFDGGLTWKSAQTQ